MIGNYKVKAFVFAGRRKYMELCIRLLLQHKAIDGITVCVNTRTKEDYAYSMSLPSLSEKISVLEVPKELEGCHANQKFFYFYQKHCDIDTIYFKVDDDIVYLSPDAVDNMLKFRLEHPEYVLVMPFVVNNPFCNCMIRNKWIVDGHGDAGYMDATWASGEFAKNIHESFIKYGISDVDDTEFDHTSAHYMKYRKDWIRPAINMICYFGFDMMNMVNDVGTKFRDDSDEQYIVHDFTLNSRRKNIVLTNSVAAHYSFYCQTEAMKPFEDDILGKYMEKANKDYGFRIF